MFNIVKRRDFMLGRNASTKEEAEKIARDYGGEYVAVQLNNLQDVINDDESIGSERDPK